jgi:hypothetical protein
MVSLNYNEKLMRSNAQDRVFWALRGDEAVERQGLSVGGWGLSWSAMIN